MRDQPKFNRPKDNLSQGERKALKELSRDKNIVIKKPIREPQPS